MIGGILTSFVLELVVYPALYEIWRARNRVFSAEPRVSLRLAEPKSEEQTVV
jgi:hypothetical protein